MRISDWEFRRVLFRSLRSGGTMRIAVNGEMVAESHMPATIMRPAGLGETFDLGRDTGVPVTEDYAKDGAFGGKIINIDVFLGAPGTTGDLARKEDRKSTSRNSRH